MRMPCPYCESRAHAPSRCSRRPRSGKRKRRGVRAYDCETVEGVGVVLFLSSDAAGAVRYIYDPAGLSLERICEWLLDSPQGTINSGFFFDYDANQIIRLLPKTHQEQLAAGGSVFYRRWTFRHVPGKRFAVADKARGKSVTIWDSGGWAQCSFLKICTQWELGTEAERAIIAEMKARRGSFEHASEQELVAYTTLECRLLAVWVERLLDLHEASGIALRSYSGPGSTASALLRSRAWKPPEIPAPVQVIAEAAYFGGRSEISRVGPVPGPVYSYDINSAYPAAIARLPELTGATWKRVRTWKPEVWGFYHVRWEIPPRSPWGPFPIRGARLPGGRRSLSLLYPRQGEGWFHSWEVAAALEAFPNHVEIVSGMVIEPTAARPFAWVEDLARERLELKRAGDPRTFPLKVGLNSIYGKLAQRTGTAPLQCMAYAAAITAYARAELFRIAARHGHAVVLLATDGILMTEPAALPIGPHLGEWELAVHDSAWILQAGVYWAGSKQRSRGIDARALTLEDVQERWKRAGTRARVILPSRRVMGYRLACSQGKTHLTGTWFETERAVKFSPEPRRRGWKWINGALYTLPAEADQVQAVVIMDELMIGERERFDELEAMPEWTID